MLQASYGSTLRALHPNDPARRREGLEAIRRSLAAPLPSRMRAVAKLNLAGFLYQEASRSEDPSFLAEAETLTRASLAETSRDRYPLDWASGQDLLGQVALLRSDLAGGDVAALTTADTAFRVAREAMDRERYPPQWGQSNAGVGATLLFRVQAGGDVADLAEAERLLRESLPLLDARRQAGLIVAAHRLLGHIEVLRAERNRDAAAAARAEAMLREVLNRMSPGSASRAEVERLLARAAAARDAPVAQPS